METKMCTLFPLLLICLLWGVSSCLQVDPNGYMLFCPCMGRFGNQADQFLGSLRFARALNRTIVLPPWVEYPRTQPKSLQVPFNTYFKVSGINKFHRAVTMEQFMKELAPTVWPLGQRFSFCYAGRTGQSGVHGCNAKDGNPFESFWDTFSVNFDKSIYYSPLSFDGSNAHEMQRWNTKFSPKEYPVLAFTGQPGAFPVSKFDVLLHKYLQWSDEYEKMADDFITKNLERPFIGIHFRNGIDFKRACNHINDSPRLFASPQCAGYQGEHGKPTMETCYPSDKTVLKKVKEEVKRLKAKHVYVATDDRDLIDVMKKSLKKVKFVRQPQPSSPHLDLLILGRADGFIGNCISTFTAFAVRERRNKGLPVAFWGFEPKQNKDEL